jgi:hypothetical protein
MSGYGRNGFLRENAGKDKIETYIGQPGPNGGFCSLTCAFNRLETAWTVQLSADEVFVSLCPDHVLSNIRSLQILIPMKATQY